MCLFSYLSKSLFGGSDSNYLPRVRAMEYTIVVAKKIDSPTILKYLVPYIGLHLAEYFMHCLVPYTLIIYDDPSKKVEGYHQMSLLLGRTQL